MGRGGEGSRGSLGSEFGATRQQEGNSNDTKKGTRGQNLAFNRGTLGQERVHKGFDHLDIGG